MPRPPVVLPSRALAAIGKMNALTELSLTGLELEPDSLRPLTSLRGLKSLRIPNTKAPLVSLLELNRALPELEIETNGCQLSPASHTVQLAGAGTTDADVVAVAAQREHRDHLGVAAEVERSAPRTVPISTAVNTPSRVIAASSSIKVKPRACPGGRTTTRETPLTG